MGTCKQVDLGLVGKCVEDWALEAGMKKYADKKAKSIAEGVEFVKTNTLAKEKKAALARRGWL